MGLQLLTAAGWRQDCARAHSINVYKTLPPQCRPGAWVIVGAFEAMDWIERNRGISRTCQLQWICQPHWRWRWRRASCSSMAFPAPVRYLRAAKLPASDGFLAGGRPRLLQYSSRSLHYCVDVFRFCELSVSVELVMGRLHRRSVCMLAIA